MIGDTVNLHVYAIASTPEIARNIQHAQLAFAARTAPSGTSTLRSAAASPMGGHNSRLRNYRSD